MSAMSATVGFHGNKYGAVELKEAYHRNWSVALLIATVIHFGVIGSYIVSSVFADGKDRRDPIDGIRIYPHYIPPPIGNPKLPATSPAGSKVKQNIGAPLPVPDIEINADQTIAPQDQMNLSDSPVGEVAGSGEPAQPPIEIIEKEPPRDTWLPLEKHPAIVKRVEPAYPELALRAGMEGKVTVRVWVDKEGKPRQVEIFASNAEIFNESALAAARQFLFTPAIMNNNPVSVWVALPFRFTLADRK